MSVSSTRKVSSSTATNRRPERNFAVAGKGEAFVENIDTTNNVSVYDDLHQRNDNPQENPKKKESNEESRSISASPTYVASAIEALAASGVYDEAENARPNNSTSHQIGVYGNNQAIIKEEQNERQGHPYLKHFYEKNEIVEEVDELV